MTGSLFLLALFGQAEGAPPPGPPSIVSIVPQLDRCDRSGGDVVVCGRRPGERSPYRLPPVPDRFDPAGDTSSVSAERHELYEVGESGIHSCSTVGPGGFTGCTFKQWKRGYEQWAGKPPRLTKPGGGE